MAAKLLSRRSFLRYAAAGGGALLASLAGCTKEVEVTREVVKKETVVVAPTEVPIPTPASFDLAIWGANWWFAGTDEIHTKYAQAIEEKFKDKYPNGNLVYEEHGWAEQLFANVGMSLMAGIIPDAVIGEAFILPYAVLGALYPLDEYFEDIKNDIVPHTTDAATLGGVNYGLPFCTTCRMLFRNGDTLEKAGVDPDYVPKTWDELMAVCEEIGKTEGLYGYHFMVEPPGSLSSYGMYLNFQAYLMQIDGPAAKGEPPQPWFDNPASTPAYQFHKDMVKYCMPGAVFTQSAPFFTGEVAYAPNGDPGWVRHAMANYGQKKPGISALPIGPGGHMATTLVCNFIMSVLAQSAHPEATATWVRILLDDELQDMTNIDGMGFFPTRVTAMERLRTKWQGTENEYLIEVLDVLEDPGAANTVPQWHKDPQKCWTSWNNMYSEMMSTDTPIPELQAKWQKEIETQLGA